MHGYEHSFTWAYILYVIAIIFVIVAAIFAIWFFSLDASDDDRDQNRDHGKRRDTRKDTLDKFRISQLFFLGAISVILISIFSGARQASYYAMEHNLIGPKMHSP